MYRQTGPSKGNRRAPVAAPGRPRPTAQRGGGGNKAAGSPVPTAESSTVATVSPSGVVASPSGSPAARRRATASKRRTTRIRREVSREERKRAAAALAQVAAARGKRSRERATAPKPSSYLGRRTAGTPTKGELAAARKSGTLKVNKAGAVTTPAVRQTSKELRKAAAQVAKTSGLTGPLTPDQKKFAMQVAKETGLSPRVVAAQALAEESGSYAAEREAEGNNDWLNIGYYDSGPGAITKTPEWKDPESAAKATSEFFKDKKFGPSESIAAIVPTSAGKSDAAQIAAIGNSNWATSGAYRESIEGTHQLIGLKSNPKAKRRLVAAKKSAKELGLKPKVGAAARKLSPETIKVRNLSRKVAALPIVKQNKTGTIKLAGGSVVLTDTSDGPAEVRKGMEPQITARLLMLSAKVGQPVYVISAARTPQHSVEVGGFPDDPHTKGEAQDIGVGAPTLASAAAIPESTYESVGLYRPFGTAQGGSSAEDNHVQIMPGAAGSVTVTPTEVSGGSVPPTTGGSVPPGAIAAYAKATGQTPAQVRKKLKGKNRAKLLTTLQRYNRAKRKLRAVGAPLTSSPKSRGSESHPILEELKAKYGSAPTSSSKLKQAAEAATTAA